MTDFIADSVAPSQGAAFSASGLLSKAAETALEIARIKAEGGKAVGSAYPTGQTNPERLASDQDVIPTNSAARVQEAASKYLPWIIGGAIVISITFAALALRRR